MEEVFRFYSNSRNIFIHKSLSLKPSTIDDPKSGYGLFVEPSKFKNDELKSETIQLLRIPKRCTFNINTLLALLGDEDEFFQRKNFKELMTKLRLLFVK